MVEREKWSPTPERIDAILALVKADLLRERGGPERVPSVPTAEGEVYQEQIRRACMAFMQAYPMPDDCRDAMARIRVLEGPMVQLESAIVDATEPGDKWAQLRSENPRRIRVTVQFEYVNPITAGTPLLSGGDYASPSLRDAEARAFLEGFAHAREQLRPGRPAAHA